MLLSPMNSNHSIMSTETLTPTVCGVSCQDFAKECPIRSCEVQCRQTKTFLRKIRLSRDDQPAGGTTYLLSVSRMRMLHHPFTTEAIQELLSRPETTIIFLVPVQLIFHPHLFAFSRIPKACGSSIQIFPFDPLDEKDDIEVVKGLKKFCKTQPIDGFMAFDEDWPSRCRLAGMVKEINAGR